MMLLFSHPVMSDSLWPPWTTAHQASSSLTISPSLPRFTSFASVMPSSYLILWCPILLLPSIFPSMRDFSNESAVCIRWPKYWSFSGSISHSSEYSGLISLKIDWFDLFAVQGTFRSLLQNHSSKASIFWHSAFFTVWLSQPYVTTGKTIALTIWTFVGRVTYPGLLHCRWILYQLNYQESPTVFHSGCKFTFSPTVYKGPPFLHTLSNTCYFLCFW